MNVRFGYFLLFLAGLSVTMSSAYANVFDWPAAGNSVIGNIQYTTVADGETLLDIAERYGLGYADIRDANPDLDPWIPEVGVQVTLPTRFILPETPWQGIVINLAEYRLYHFLPERKEIHSYPIGIGKTNTPTPKGDMAITARIPNPTWYPPASIRAAWEAQGREVRRQIPAGPDNPLGPFAIALSAKGYLIHGSNQAFGVGTQASAGCIRMNNWDIEHLVNHTQIGIEVRIIDHPVAVGIYANDLVLKVHRPLNQLSSPLSHTDLVYQLQRVRQRQTVEIGNIDWNIVEQIFTQQRGIARIITL